MDLLPNLVELIKKAAIEAVDTSKPTAVVFGTVVSTSPLKISVEQKLTLTEEFLILTKNVMDYQTQISFDNPSIKQVFTTWNMSEISESTPSKLSFKESIEHDVTIYNALQKDETVILIRLQGGQKYIVLDKVVM